MPVAERPLRTYEYRNELIEARLACPPPLPPEPLGATSFRLDSVRILPADSYASSVTVEFSWNPVPGATHYKVFVRNDSGGRFLESDADILNNSGSIWYDFESPLLTSTTYSLELITGNRSNIFVFAYRNDERGAVPPTLLCLFNDGTYGGVRASIWPSISTSFTGLPAGATNPWYLFENRRDIYPESRVVYTNLLTGDSQSYLYDITDNPDYPNLPDINAYYGVGPSTFKLFRDITGVGDRIIYVTPPPIPAPDLSLNNVTRVGTPPITPVTINVAWPAVAGASFYKVFIHYDAKPYILSGDNIPLFDTYGTFWFDTELTVLDNGSQTYSRDIQLTRTKTNIIILSYKNGMRGAMPTTQLYVNKISGLVELWPIIEYTFSNSNIWSEFDDTVNFPNASLSILNTHTGQSMSNILPSSIDNLPQFAEISNNDPIDSKNI